MALTTGLQIPFGIQPVNPVPVDAWSGPYTGSLGNDNEAGAISAANESIPSAIRFQSMEVPHSVYPRKLQHLLTLYFPQRHKTTFLVGKISTY